MRVLRLRIFAALGAVVMAALVGLVVFVGRPVQAQTGPGGNILGVQIPDAAQAALTQAELVEAICAMAKWRSGELFAAVDAVAATQPQAERALKDAGIDYALPNPQTLRDRGNAALASICGAVSVSEALARQSALIDVNTEMEAKYGALSEALGGQIKQAVDVKEKAIRAEINAFVDNERAKSEAALRPEAEALAQQYVASVQSTAQAQMGAEAAAMGKSGVSAAAIEAAMSARIAELKASSQVEVEAKVQAALAARIESAKAQITAEATKMGEAAKAREEARMKPVGEAFDRMMNETLARVNAARTADTPERRAAIEIRVRLAVKTADAFWNKARPTIEANRAELAALKATGGTPLDADGIAALWQRQRSDLERQLRATMAAGDESGFVAATLAFQKSWEEMASGVDAALGTWQPQRICDASRAPVEQARSQLAAALQQMQAAQQSVSGVSTSGDDGARVALLQAALQRGVTNFTKYTGDADGLLAACKAPAGASPPALFVQLDALRAQQDVARGELEQIQALGAGLSGGTR